MADTIGGVVPLPGMGSGTYVADPEILYSAVGVVQIGVTLASGNGVVAAGTLLGRVADSGKYAPYNNSNSNGTETAVGVLRTGVDTGSGDALGNLVLSGTVRRSKLTGLDANALTDLNARQDSVLDTVIF